MAQDNVYKFTQARTNSVLFGVFKQINNRLFLATTNFETYGVYI